MQSIASMALRLRQTPWRVGWNAFASDRKLACAAVAALVCGMGVLGLFVAAHIKDNLVHKAAAATALYTDSFIAPLARVTRAWACCRRPCAATSASQLDD